MIEQNGENATEEKPVFPPGDEDASVIARELPDGRTMSFDADNKLVIKRKHLTPGADMKVGDVREDGTIYIGTWEPKKLNGKSLGKIFNLFAAPEDLTDSSDQKVLLTFNDAVEHVADLKNWHGHNGGEFRNEKAVLKAVRKNPEALENWFIPTKEILHGQDKGRNEVQTDNLYAHKDQGALRETFITSSGSVSTPFGTGRVRSFGAPRPSCTTLVSRTGRCTRTTSTTTSCPSALSERSFDRSTRLHGHRLQRRALFNALMLTTAG